MDIEDLKELMREAKRSFDDEMEQLQERAERNNKLLKFLDCFESLLGENKQLRNEMEEQRVEIDNLHQLVEEKDMKLNEMSKFSVNMAKKSSQEGMEKALRIYVNTSKRKTQSKREVAKAHLLELIATAKMEVPDDLMESINRLDDEVVAEPAPTTNVTIEAGGINVQQANTVTK